MKRPTNYPRHLAEEAGFAADSIPSAHTEAWRAGWRVGYVEPTAAGRARNPFPRYVTAAVPRFRVWDEAFSEGKAARQHDDHRVREAALLITGDDARCTASEVGRWSEAAFDTIVGLLDRLDEEGAEL